MARFSLGLILTVRMVATRLSSAIRAGSPDSSRWWETKNFAEFTEIAHARRTGSSTALDANRAASLRLLNEEQARDPSPRGTVSRQSRRLRLKPTEMGSAAGVGISVMFAENFRTRNSLTLFQQGLGESDLLLGFYLRKFREAVASEVPTGGGPAGDRLGAALHQRLVISHELPRPASWWTTTGVARPIQILERTAARRDNWLQALSAQRGPRLGDGLLGLSRTWTMAGARTVVATNWPVPETQLIHSGTWQAAPSHWAAFQVTGGGR